VNVTAPETRFDAAYYTTIYRNYERQNPDYKFALYRRSIGRQIGSAAQHSILDVGCAFGGFLGSLSPEWNRSGIDISSYAIQHAEQRHRTVRFAAATLDRNPFRGPFDVVTSFDVIEHISDIEDVGRAVSDLLKPKALFVFVVPVYDGPLGWLAHLLDRDPTHIHKTARKRWLDWAGRHFEVIEWFGLFRFLFPVAPYLHISSVKARRVSPAILVVARKR
jgi:SAM-dependent methyltransferase